MLAVMPIVAWGAAITVGLGAILVVVGLTGRKLGFLGFLSVFAVLLAVLFAANADLVRDRYETTWVWDEEVVFEPDDLVLEEGFDNSVDLTAELANDYSAVFIAGSCTSPSEVEPWSEVKYFGESMASMRLDTVDDDVDIDLVASYTRLEIPTGASLEVVGSAYTTVVWEDRDSSCSAWSNDYEEEYDEDGYAVLDSSQTLLSVTNPNAPVITINAGTGTDKSIYIQEVAP